MVQLQAEVRLCRLHRCVEPDDGAALRAVYAGPPGVRSGIDEGRELLGASN